MMSFQIKDTFEDLVQKLITKFGPDFKETLLNQQQQIHDWISVMVNGTNISSEDDSGFSHPLSHEQEIVFCAFMSGGTQEKESSKLSIYA
jgi:molybdopterin converting factor small subunit